MLGDGACEPACAARSERAACMTVNSVGRRGLIAPTIGLHLRVGFLCHVITTDVNNDALQKPDAEIMMP